MLADEMDTGLEREEAILRQAQMVLSFPDLLIPRSSSLIGNECVGCTVKYQGQDRGRGIDTETMAHPSSSTSSSNQDVASMKLQ
eukprot:3507785-Rhodomonas_salina.1